jgi:hypothetical protein
MSDKDLSTGTLRVKTGLAEMLKGGVIMDVVNAEQAKIAEDAAGSSSLEIVLKGTGRASVFRDGQRFDGAWTAGADAPPLFKAEDGSTIKLSPGNTWFQVIANSQNIVLQ